MTAADIRKQGWMKEATVLVRVGQHHMAFLRAYLEGLDLSKIAQQYLETATDEKVDLETARGTLKWIRRQLMGAARRGKGIPNARLILLDPHKLVVQPVKNLPTLEEFREDHDPYEMFSEAELIEMFQSEFGGNGLKIDRKAVRNERLRKKQVDALFYFEKLLVLTPKLTDSVHAWLHPTLAHRLEDHGLTNLQQLVYEVNAKGYRWWRDVPRFGEKAALQVVKWLRTESLQEALGIEVGPQAWNKSRSLTVTDKKLVRKPSFGIVPLEFLLLDTELSGISGNNRIATNGTKPWDDMKAIQSYLEAKGINPSTYRAMRKEIERFLIWCTNELSKPLSSVNLEDVTLYRSFLIALKHPAPTNTKSNAESVSRSVSLSVSIADTDSTSWPFSIPMRSWLAPRGTSRLSENWRPFEGALKERNIDYAIMSLQALFTWLVDSGYLRYNPWRSIGKLHKERILPDAGRSFTKFEWKFLMNFLDAMDKNDHYSRLRFILIFLFGTGLRAGELVKATIGDIQRIHDVDGTHHQKFILNVLGKNNVERNVPLPSFLLKELDVYLTARGQPGRFELPKETLLITRLPQARSSKEESTGLVENSDLLSKPLTTNGLYDILTTFFGAAAKGIDLKIDKLRAEENVNFELIESLKYMSSHFDKASTHWLRHTCGSHAISMGVNIKSLQTNFGHKSIETTSIYTDQEEGKRVDEMADFLERSFII